jgi:Sec-independent protein secretion pathway component TatC
MFEQESQINSIILAGIILIIYETMVLLCFYFLAPVVMMILYSIFNSEITIANHGAMYSGEFYFITTMMFAVAFLIPVVWFVLWVFRTESGYQIFGVRR